MIQFIFIIYFVGNKIKEELIKLVALQEIIKDDICKAVIVTLFEIDVNFLIFVSVATDSAPSMTDKESVLTP